MLGENILEIDVTFEDNRSKEWQFTDHLLLPSKLTRGGTYIKTEGSGIFALHSVIVESFYAQYRSNPKYLESSWSKYSWTLQRSWLWRTFNAAVKSIPSLCNVKYPMHWHWQMILETWCTRHQLYNYRKSHTHTYAHTQWLASWNAWR